VNRIAFLLFFGLFGFLVFAALVGPAVARRSVGISFLGSGSFFSTRPAPNTLRFGFRLPLVGRDVKNAEPFGEKKSLHHKGGVGR
jgi:hypothetical protein